MQHRKSEGSMISVIMLTYNREHLVARAIESILNQTFRDFEFIIVDNGSTDSSGQICDKYALGDTRIRVIHHKRGNIGMGRNAGLDVARGEYITFVDDDDYAEADFLEFLYNLSIDYEADIAICGAADRVYDEKLVMDTETALIELMWRRCYNVAFPTKLFKRDLFKGLRFPAEGLYDDIALMYKVLAKANTVVYHGLAKYTFFRHSLNNSAWTTDYSLLTPETLDEYLCAYRERTVWLSERFPNSAAVFRYFEWSFMISMVEKINYYKLTDCIEQLNDMLYKLRICREEFLNSGFILDNEREWIEKYL